MEKYINDFNKECYRGVTPETKFNDLEFHEVDMTYTDDDYQWVLHTNLGSITVLDRLTGSGWRDVETGFRDPEYKFWLASGMYDVRNSGVETIQDAIEWIKMNSNNCQGC